MFKNKIINQQGIKDCGPACLAMLINHHKGYVEIERLKEMCKTSKNGTTAYDLIESCKQCGFESYALKAKLNENLVYPLIAHITLNNSYNHFVVVTKCTKNKIYVNDPARGKIKYTVDKFNEIFNEVVLIAYPNQKIRTDSKYKISNFILDITNSSIQEIKELVLISLFITILAIISSFYFQIMIENVVQPLEKIYLVFLIFLIINFLKIILKYLRNKILILIQEKIDLNITYNSFKQIVLLPYNYYRNHTTGEIISRINDLEIVRNVISKAAINLFIDIPLTFISLIILFILNKTLCFFSIFLIMLYLIITLAFKKYIEININEIQNKKANYNSYMVEVISGFETIKGLNKEKQTLKNFEIKFANYLEHMYKFENKYNIQYLLKEMINKLGFLITILIGIILINRNQLTLSELLTYNALLLYFMQPIKNLIDMEYEIKQAKISIIKIMSIFKDKEKDFITENSFQGPIKFKNLSYKINDKILLDNINLTLNQGEKVILYGKSGSGKSTICKILKKYYIINRNQLYINNIDINDYKDSDILYVSQNEVLFTNTIKNNIGKKLLENSRTCLVEEIVKDMPLGYNTLIEENGFNISGGQKQRIILARALNEQFNILIIDEGLSQVDTKMERTILQNLFIKYKDKTIIFISHRLDNIDLFDQKIKLEEGKINNE